MDKRVHIFVHGITGNGNPSHSIYYAAVLYSEKWGVKKIVGHDISQDIKQTSNQALLRGLIVALNDLTNMRWSVLVHSNSDWLVNHINKGLNKWMPHIEMWNYLFAVSENKCSTFKAVKEEKKSPYIDLCDSLAKNEKESFYNA